MKNKALAGATLLTLLTFTCADAQDSPSVKPRQIAVNVLGEVNNQGRYLLPEGATVLDALGAAGGQTQDTDLKHVSLIHAPAGDKPQADKVNLKAVLAGTEVAPKLYEGDSLKFSRKIIAIQY